DPPRPTVSCPTATSDPAFSGIVPSDMLDPRANGMFVSPTGGVAPLVARVIAVTTPASPMLISAHPTARFMPPPSRTCRSGSVVSRDPGTSLHSLQGAFRSPRAGSLRSLVEVERLHDRRRFG